MATKVSSNRRDFHQSATDFLVKWGPRAVVAALAAYYGLGIAYEAGIMADIDRLLIRILKQYGGYVAIGAMMPTAQWYAALVVRISLGFIAGLLYDLAEKCIKIFCRCVSSAIQYCCGKTSKRKIRI